VVRLLGLGVPWDEAWKMSPESALACIVIAGEQEGASWDWRRME